MSLSAVHSHRWRRQNCARRPCHGLLIHTTWTNSARLTDLISDTPLKSFWGKRGVISPKAVWGQCAGMLVLWAVLVAYRKTRCDKAGAISSKAGSRPSFP